MKNAKDGNRLEVKSGRPPTRLGNDGIDSYLIIPHLQLDAICRVLDKGKIKYNVVLGVSRIAVPRPGSGWSFDRFGFPDDDIELIQTLLDEIEGTAID